MATTVCVTNKCSQMKLEVNEQESDDEGLSNKSLLISIAATLSKLKRKVLINRGVDVTEKMERNSAKLFKYTTCLSDSTKQLGDKIFPDGDKLTFRVQKVVSNLSNTDLGSDGKDEGLTAAASSSFGNSSGGKPAIRPTKLISQQNVPPYTTWIYLDRNQRMTEDQSVQGRRRIYYDPVGNETLIASDSEEEEVEDEEPKHDFSKGEDYIIWTAVQERGASDLLFEQISQCIHVKHEEVQARYELLVNDIDKRAKCEAHAEGIRSKVPSPAARRKGTKDLGRLALKETKLGQDAESYVKTGGNGLDLKLEVGKVEAKDLVAAMDSFDNLFCRRCLVFDCRLHGCSQPLVHPSERQPATNSDAESVVPCGLHCHLLRAGGAASNSGLPEISKSKSGDFSSLPEVTDRPRVAKRQKIQEGETCWTGEKVEPEKIVDLSRSKVASHIAAGERRETPFLNGYKDGAQFNKRHHPSIASRLTSHKKLARCSSRRAVEENGAVGSSSEHPQSPGTLIDLTGFDEESFKNDTTSLVYQKSLENVMQDLEIPDVSKLPCHLRHGYLKEEKTRVTSTKKLARSGKRAFLEGLSSLVDTDQTQADQVDGDPMDLGQGEVGTKIQVQAINCTHPLPGTGRVYHQRPVGHETSTHAMDCTSSTAHTLILAADVSVPLVKKLALTVEKATQEKVVGSAISTSSSSSDRVPMDMGRMGVDLFKEKCKVTSPKKLARSARKPVAVKLTGIAELQPPQTPGELKSAAIHEEKPSKEEKKRSTAARKLARSARKVFAEKVAGAIQHQQLQTQVDPNNISRGRKEQSKEERFFAAGSHDHMSVTAGTVISLKGRNQPQALLNKYDTLSGFDSSQPMIKKRHMSGDFEDAETDLEVKQDGTVVGTLEITRSTGRTISKSGHDSIGVEFKDNWSAFEKGLYEKGLQIFGRSSCMIASTMLKGCKTCAEVGEYIVAQEAAALQGAEAGLHQFPESLACVLKWDVARARARFYGRRRGSRKLKFTLKSAGQSAIRKRMVNGKDTPCRQYTPCGCLFTCGKQCPCQLSGTCCEKYCGCAKSCKNRFRGCHCAKSQCCSRQCPCFAAGRECDPDVCRNCWIGCGDGKLAGPPQKEDKDNYQCHNMKLLLKQQQRVLLSRSDVAGWGAFLKNTVSKHEYLGEYTGELISHREADKRGKIYDRENSSFLFNLNDQCVLDACRKGDKLKFANHSPNPNCYAKVIMVAGDHRVGIFAKERIAAGEELFYDYRYEADRAPAWARKGEDNGYGKKDDTGPSERRSKQAS